LKLRVFSVIRMAQVWAGIRFIGLRLEVRFYARRREPSGADILFGVAQLDAAAARHGFMAVAVTSRGGNSLQARGHIAIEGSDWEERKDEYGGQANTEGSVGNDG
jgi:hypothetical protein